MQVAHHHAFVHPARTTEALRIEPGMTVVDFGAGSGAYVPLFAEAVGPEGRVYAIDVQKDLLRRIANEAQHRGHSHVQTLWSDVEEKQGTRLRDGIADLVFISNLLFQLAHPEFALEEAKRIAKLHGRVIVIDWEDLAPENPHAKRLLGPRREHLVPRERAYELSRAAGLAFVEELPAGAHHYGFVFMPDLQQPL